MAFNPIHQLTKLSLAENQHTNEMLISNLRMSHACTLLVHYFLAKLLENKAIYISFKLHHEDK